MATLAVVLPDQQIPYHDQRLHELVLRWLETNRPEIGVLSGDLIDLPSVSKYEWSPDQDPNPIHSAAAAIAATQSYLAELVQAAVACQQWHITLGNHDVRLEKFLARNAPQLYSLQEADGRRTLAIDRLLGFERHNFKVAPGGWPHGKLWLDDQIAVQHGWKVRSSSAASALATVQHLGHSVVIGHTHRQGIAYVTYQTPQGPRILVGAEAGTLASCENGLGHSVAPNWQPGFATVELEDGSPPAVELASYVNGTLLWRGQRYTHSAGLVRVSL